MAKTLSLQEVLETVEQLSLGDQEALMDIVRRRIIEQRRAELARDIREAQKEFKAGNVRRATPDQLRREILS